MDLINHPQHPSPHQSSSNNILLWSYQKLVFRLVFILSKRLVKYYQNESINEHKFIKQLEQIITEMRDCESKLPLSFKATQALQMLREFLKKDISTIIFDEDIPVTNNTQIPQQQQNNTSGNYQQYNKLQNLSLQNNLPLFEDYYQTNNNNNSQYQQKQKQIQFQQKQEQEQEQQFQEQEQFQQYQQQIQDIDIMKKMQNKNKNSNSIDSKEQNNEHQMPELKQKPTFKKINPLKKINVEIDKQHMIKYKFGEYVDEQESQDGKSNSKQNKQSISPFNKGNKNQTAFTPQSNLKKQQQQNSLNLQQEILQQQPEQDQEQSVQIKQQKSRKEKTLSIDKMNQNSYSIYQNSPTIRSYQNNTLKRQMVEKGYQNSIQKDKKPSHQQNTQTGTAINSLTDIYSNQNHSFDVEPNSSKNNNNKNNNKNTSISRNRSFTPFHNPQVQRRNNQTQQTIETLNQYNRSTENTRSKNQILQQQQFYNKETLQIGAPSSQIYPLNVDEQQVYQILKQNQKQIRTMQKVKSSDSRGQDQKSFSQEKRTLDSRSDGMLPPVQEYSTMTTTMMMKKKKNNSQNNNPNNQNQYKQFIQSISKTIPDSVAHQPKSNALNGNKNINNNIQNTEEKKDLKQRIQPQSQSSFQQQYQSQQQSQFQIQSQQQQYKPQQYSLPQQLQLQQSQPQQQYQKNVVEHTYYSNQLDRFLEKESEQIYEKITSQNKRKYQNVVVPRIFETDNTGQIVYLKENYSKLQKQFQTSQSNCSNKNLLLTSNNSELTYTSQEKK